MDTVEDTLPKPSPVRAPPGPDHCALGAGDAPPGRPHALPAPDLRGGDWATAAHADKENEQREVGFHTETQDSFSSFYDFKSEIGFIEDPE